MGSLNPSLNTRVGRMKTRIQTTVPQKLETAAGRIQTACQIGMLVAGAALTIAQALRERNQ